MAKNDGRGSILLKLLIVILALVLIAVIIIPAQIWEQEETELNTGRSNLTSVYEAERFYHRLTDSFTTDPRELLSVVHGDSSLIQLNQVVNYTRQLANLMDSFKKIPMLQSVDKISVNVERIQEDLDANKHYFKDYEDIANEAVSLGMQLAEFNTAAQLPNYVTTSAYLDSLTNLRRDMSDYSLQTCALKAKTITDTLAKLIDKIEFSELQNNWAPLSERIAAFAKTVLTSELVNVTSAGDRIRDFRQNAENSLLALQTTTSEQDIEKAKSISAKIDEKYEAYLSDFLITSKRALYKLAEADSLVLHLTEENFYCPATKEEVKILISPDSSFVKVESPVLVKELQEKLSPVSESIRNLASLNAIKAYKDTLEAIKEKGSVTRKALRKNTDIFIAFKTTEEIVNRFNDIGIMTAFTDLNKMATTSDSCESYSNLKDMTESSLNGIRIFNQAYSESFFGNLDSLNRDLIVSLNEFDSLLTKVRRLPKSIEKFEQDIANLNQALANVKNANDSNLSELEIKLGDIFLFASEGSTEPVYVVFNKKIKNFGYISRGTKSWEEE